MMHQSEFDAANFALSQAADKRKSLINIHKNQYTVTLSIMFQMCLISTLGQQSYSFLVSVHIVMGIAIYCARALRVIDWIGVFLGTLGRQTHYACQIHKFPATLAVVTIYYVARSGLPQLI